MRPIRFRAWDIERKQWIENIDSWRVTYLNGDNDSPPCVVMQFTGLIDKNGLEIYDGDLIRFANGNSPWVISWHQSTARWVGRADTVVLNLIDEPQKYEVLGNIHEDSDLVT
jgi:hypothetical protein